MTRMTLRPSLRARAAAVVISGLPYTHTGGGLPEPTHVADDAILGRLACPALSRLNLQKKQSEPLLLRSVTQPKGTEWRFVLKTGLYWWNGDSVSSQDLSTFLKGAICPAASRKLGSSITCGAFKIDSSEQGADHAPVATVTWSSPPEFGAFVLNDVPLQRTGKDGTKECAGLYRFDRDDHGALNLSPTPGYRQKRPHLTILDRANSKLIQRTDWEFKYATDVDKHDSCRTPSLFPGVVGILWNDRAESLVGSIPEIRKALTQLMPRGDLLRAGANSMGDLVASFLPSQHPAYHPVTKVLSYDATLASKTFEKHGWARLRADGPRLDRKTQQPVILNLAVIGEQSQGTELLQKVIGDSFALVGIQTNFIPVKGAALEQPATWDGAIGFFASDWPSVNMLDASKNLPLVRLFTRSKIFEDDEHRRLTRDYALSLTTTKPDFEKLKQLHQKWQAAEVFSPVFQVGICASHRGRSVRRIDFSDPDWFRSLVL